MVFHHVIEINSVLDSIYKVLKDDGIFLIVDLNEDKGGLFHSEYEVYDGHNGFTKEEITKYLNDSNFELIDFKTIFKGVKHFSDRDLDVDYSLFMAIAKKRCN